MTSETVDTAATGGTGEDTAIRSGGCLCKAIRFTVSGEPDYPHTCSCPHCQIRGGGPMQSWVSFPKDTLTWTGTAELKWFETFPGETKRGWCPECGSHIAAIDDGDDVWIGINTTALDDSNDPALVPINQSFRGNAVPWLNQVPDTQHQHAAG